MDLEAEDEGERGGEKGVLRDSGEGVVHRDGRGESAAVGDDREAFVAGPDVDCGVG